MHFTKMHGTGNDHIYVDAFIEDVRDPGALALALCRPHTGIGGDGLVRIGPSDTADFSMRVWNADGAEAEMCGNATRCVGKYVYERGLTANTELTLETRSGIRRLWLNLRAGKVSSVRVDMGAPSFAPADIGVLLPGDAVINAPIEAAGRTWRMTCVSMGNPHCVVFIDHDPAELCLPDIGPVFEHHPLFAHRTNTEFVQALSPTELRMRVWERGSGETLACGTGACATLVAAVRNGFARREADIHLAGGDLSVAWDEATGHLYKTGPAVILFDGEWLENEC